MLIQLSFGGDTDQAGMEEALQRYGRRRLRGHPTYPARIGAEMGDDMKGSERNRARELCRRARLEEYSQGESNPCDQDENLASCH